LTLRIVDDVLYISYQLLPDYYQLVQYIPSTQQELLPLFFDSSHNYIQEPLVSCSSVHYIPTYQKPSFLIQLAVNLALGGEIRRSTIFGADDFLLSGENTLYLGQREFSSGNPLEGYSTRILSFGITSFPTVLGEYLQKGTLVDMNSMNEYEGTLQVVTSVSQIGAGINTTTKASLAVLSPKLELLGKKEGITVGAVQTQFFGSKLLLGSYWGGGMDGKQIGLYLVDVSNPSTITLSQNFAPPMPTYYPFMEEITPSSTSQATPIGELSRDVQNFVAISNDEVLVMKSDYPLCCAQGSSSQAYEQPAVSVKLINIKNINQPTILSEVALDKGESLQYMMSSYIWDAENHLFYLPAQGYSSSGNPTFTGVYVIKVESGGTLVIKAKLTNATKDNPWESILGVKKISNSLVTFSYTTQMYWDAISFKSLFTKPYTYTDLPDPQNPVRYDFSKGIDVAAGFGAMWQSQTQPKDTQFNTNNDEYFDVSPGAVLTVQAQFMNNGMYAWYKDTLDREVAISIYKDTAVQSAPKNLGYDDPNNPNFGKSYFKSDDWTSEYRITTMSEEVVQPGEIGTFTITFKVPSDAPLGKYREDITLSTGNLWMMNTTNGDPLNAAHIWIGLDVQPQSQIVTPVPTEELIVCIMDAMVCPNGTSVGRIPPSCNFAPCS
jgi:hypothetical protein